MAIVRQEKQMTVASAMNEGTSLKKLEKLSPVVTTKVVMGLILRQADLFNLKNNFNEMQAAVLASDLIEVFGYETLEDVVMMFKLARQGKLGKIFGRLDSETVMGTWIPAYLELKAIEREKAHISRKKKPETTGCSERSVKMLDLILKNLSSEKREIRNYYPKFTRRCHMMAKMWDDDTLANKHKRAVEIKADEATRVLQNEINRREGLNKLNE